MLYEVFVLMSISCRVVLFQFHHEIIHSFLCFFHVQLSSIGVTLTSVRKNRKDLQFLIVIIEECVTRRHSDSLLALDATLSSWESKDHRILWIRAWNRALDYLLLLCPELLSDLIVVETHRYGGCKAMWVDVDREELLSFFGLVTMMGIKRLPRLENYWSKDFNFCCNSPLRKVMSRTRF